ncbi:MAG: hypothetical protein CMLOHMNK_03279 [Steroidobacteraceae bacterium]|nr:hypothetical protein [Steroidobacteraceae bacterium]
MDAQLPAMLLSVALGVGLAAATGLRLFLPFLVVGIAANSGHLELAPAFEWLASTPALVMLSVATVIEVLAYYLPGVDNLLDAIATPAAIVAGAVVAAAVMTDLPPIVRWTTALIAGGGVAGLTQGVTALLRAKSTAFTGGLGNGAVATGELGGSIAMAFLAIAAPVLAVALVIALIWIAVRFARRLLRPAR